MIKFKSQVQGLANTISFFLGQELILQLKL